MLGSGYPTESIFFPRVQVFFKPITVASINSLTFHNFTNTRISLITNIHGTLKYN
jgi:hypothetical protein